MYLNNVNTLWHVSNICVSISTEVFYVAPKANMTTSQIHQAAVVPNSTGYQSNQTPNDNFSSNANTPSDEFKPPHGPSAVIFVDDDEHMDETDDIRSAACYFFKPS